MSMGKAPATQKECMCVNNSWILPKTHKDNFYVILFHCQNNCFSFPVYIGSLGFLDNSNHGYSSLNRLATSKIHYSCVKSCYIQTVFYPRRIPVSRRLSQEHFTCTNTMGILERDYWNKLKPSSSIQIFLLELGEECQCLAVGMECRPGPLRVPRTLAQGQQRWSRTPTRDSCPYGVVAGDYLYSGTWMSA